MHRHVYTIHRPIKSTIVEYSSLIFTIFQAFVLRNVTKVVSIIIIRQSNNRNSFVCCPLCICWCVLISVFCVSSLTIIVVILLKLSRQLNSKTGDANCLYLSLSPKSSHVGIWCPSPEIKMKVFCCIHSMFFCIFCSILPSKLFWTIMESEQVKDW